MSAYRPPPSIDSMKKGAGGGGAGRRGKRNSQAVGLSGLSGMGGMGGMGGAGGVGGVGVRNTRKGSVMFSSERKQNIAQRRQSVLGPSPSMPGRGGRTALRGDERFLEVYDGGGESLYRSFAYFDRKGAGKHLVDT